VLVEDTVANLKSAHQLGLHTVWMQHYLRQGRPVIPLPSVCMGATRRWMCA